MGTGTTSSGCSERTTCEIDMKLPSLNDYVRACRSNRFQGSKMKKDLESQIGFYIATLPRFDVPVKIHFHWVEGTRRRDYDNVAFAKKFILDAMVEQGILIDDKRKYVAQIYDTVVDDDEDYVEVYLNECD